MTAPWYRQKNISEIAASLRTALGFGTAADQDVEDFATPDDLSALETSVNDAIAALTLDVADAGNLSSGTVPDARLPERLSPYGENNVPTDADLAQKTGGYTCNPSTTNTPSADWWYLRVEASSGGDIGQRFTRHSDGAVWVRRYVSGAWTTPKRVYQTVEEIQSVAGSSYVSPPITVTLGGLLTFAHGLGAKPTYYEAFAVCVVAEKGYSVGDEIKVGADAAGLEPGYGVQVKADDTYVYGRVGSASPATCFNWSTGAQTSASVANWKIILRAAL